MKVALFFDGKNFYRSWREKADGRRVDFSRLSSWLMKRVGATHLWGAHYYTGIEIGSAAESDAQRNLSRFLNDLEVLPGYFVYRFPRRARSGTCSNCGAETRFSLEKEVDTTMVADMLRLAAVNAFDVMVLISGDTDHAPAVEGVKMLGKKVYLASWGGYGLSTRLLRAAFDHIDLLEGVGNFEMSDSAVGLVSPLSLGGDDEADGDDLAAPRATAYGIDRSGDEDDDGDDDRDDPADILLEELRFAERQFAGGYVGLNYFVRRWKSPRLSEAPDWRSRLLDELIADGDVEVYTAEDGNKAVRIVVDEGEYEEEDDEESEYEEFDDDDGDDDADVEASDDVDDEDDER